MNKRYFSLFLSLLIILSHLFACQNTTNNQSNAIHTDTIYYSIATGKTIKENNAYMQLDIEIPKITYSNDSANTFIDPINTEIEAQLNVLIDTAKNSALETYQSYLKSARINAKNDIEKQLENLEAKYKDLIGDKEIMQISFAKQLLNSMLETTDDEKYKESTKSEAMPMFNFDKKEDAKENNFSQKASPKNNFQRNDFQKNNSNKPTNNIVNGFTATEDIIIPEFHNKRIIVIETTERTEAETNSQNNRDKSDNPNRQKRATRSNVTTKDRQLFEEKIVNEETLSTEATTKTQTGKESILETITNESDNSNYNKNLKNSATISEIEKELSIENFYIDLSKISLMRIPDIYRLTRKYIKSNISCSYQVKCLDKKYLSLFVELSESRTTKNIKRLFYNIDLDNNKIVNIKDVLGDNFKETCISNINATIDKWSKEQKSTLLADYNLDNYINENTSFFINNNHKPVVVIEKFVMTIGSTGHHEFQIQ